VLGAAGAISVLVLTQRVEVLAPLYGALLVALLTSRLPVVPILGLSALPVAMSGVFAISRAGAGWDALLVIVLKGAITSLTMLLLATTTPHTHLLRLGRKVLPQTLADMLYLGYRSIFIIWSRGLAAREAVKLRGGPAPIGRRLQRGGVVGALAVLRATELAADQYAALRLRGTPPPAPLPREEGSLGGHLRAGARSLSPRRGEGQGEGSLRSRSCSGFALVGARSLSPRRGEGQGEGSGR
jgi:energy-coupling factor transporter transmembrane protein EcfT